MIQIKVAYDAYNRKFALLDEEFGPMLNDGAVYELSLPLKRGQLGDGYEFVCIDDTKVAQA